jgi:hypothetical protein
MAVNPFNNPQTLVAKEIVARLREVSPELERRPASIDVVTTPADKAVIPVSSSSSRPLGRVVLPARGRVHTLARTSSGAS